MLILLAVLCATAPEELELLRASLRPEGLAELEANAAPLSRLPIAEVQAELFPISAQIKVNVMSQYRPVYRASKFPVMSHGVTPAEVSRAVAAARDAGLDNVFVDGRAASRASCPPPQPR